MLATLIGVSTIALGFVAQPVSAHPPGGFGVQCGFTHASMDDPIVYPNQPDMGHMHAFYGNKSTDAYSTRKTLMAAGTTCSDKKDLAAIWAPTAFIKKQGTWRPLAPYRERTYYFKPMRDTIAHMVYLPKNIKMIGGNPHAMNAAQNPAVRWFCGEGSPERPFPYDCRPYTTKGEDGIRALIDLPFCWDGTRLDSADHFSHVVYSDPNDTTPHVNPAPCPSSHPKYIPAISIRIHFQTQDPCAGATPCGPWDGGKNVRIKLSSGPYWTMHSDFWNTWVQARLDALTDKCLRPEVNCHIIGVDTTDV
jgi:Domain of unknown function (DUF1996)